jgi:hypothetical protein
MPVQVAATPARAMPAAAISVRGDRGRTLTLAGEVPASWLAELLRAL